MFLNKQKRTVECSPTIQSPREESACGLGLPICIRKRIKDGNLISEILNRDSIVGEQFNISRYCGKIKELVL